MLGKIPSLRLPLARRSTRRYQRRPKEDILIHVLGVAQGLAVVLEASVEDFPLMMQQQSPRWCEKLAAYIDIVQARCRAARTFFVQLAHFALR